MKAYKLMLQVADKVHIKSDKRKVNYWIHLIVNGDALLEYKKDGKTKIAEFYHLSELARNVG